MTKFNPKIYQGKDRVYVAIPNANHVSRVYAWDIKRRVYGPPKNGKAYLARRYETNAAGGKILRTRYFARLDECYAYQREVEPRQEVTSTMLTESVPMPQSPEPTLAVDLGPGFGEVLHHWQQRHVSRLAEGTQRHYERVSRNHFGSLMELPIRSITPKVVDEWIWECIEASKQPDASCQRLNFEHELQLLNQVLRHYDEFFDDPHYRHPIKKRHRDMVFFKKVVRQKPKDLSLEDFMKFRHALLGLGQYGELLAAMATVQFSCALRVSEVAALRHCDVHLNRTHPEQSKIVVCQHVLWLDRKGAKNRIEPGFKNAPPDNPTKEIPLFPMAYVALKPLWQPGSKELIFKVTNGTFFKYSKLRDWYNEAFERARLPYTGTHIMRHGGTRWLLDETGDLTLAQQLLGNRDLDTTLVYAQRHKRALEQHVQKHWKEVQASGEE